MSEPLINLRKSWHVVLITIFVAFFEVFTTFSVSALLSSIFSSDLEVLERYNVSVYHILIGILCYLLFYLSWLVLVNSWGFRSALFYSNKKITDEIASNLWINVSREDYVNTHVNEVFRTADKILIGGASVLLKSSASLVLLVVGFYFAGKSFMIAFAALIIVYATILLLSRKTAKSLSSGIGALNSQRISLITSIFENRIQIYSHRKVQETSVLLKSNGEAIRRIRLKANLLSSIPRLLIDVLLFLSILAAWYYLKDERIDLGKVAFAALIMVRVLPVLNQVYYGYSELRNNLTSLSSLTDIKARKLKNYGNSENSIPLVVKDLVVAYDNYVIKYENYVFEHNSHYLLTGESGSGKTSLFNAILNQNPVESGEIMVSKDAVISLTSQNARLYSGTLLYNICYCNTLDAVDQNRLNQVFSVCALDEFINCIEDLTFKKIDSLGGGLSGGQIQRLVLARSLYHEADIYLFDEVTSALDETLQRKVYERLFEYLKYKTTIHISHRPSIQSMFNEGLIYKL